MPKQTTPNVHQKNKQNNKNTTPKQTKKQKRSTPKQITSHKLHANTNQSRQIVKQTSNKPLEKKPKFKSQ